MRTFRFATVLSTILACFPTGCHRTTAEQPATAPATVAQPASQPGEKSVRPGINKAYKDNPDVTRWKGIFEGESRGVYNNRHKIVAAIAPKSPAVLADIGAGTGLFTVLFAEELRPAGKVIAVEIVPEFVEHIKKRACENNLTNVEAVLCKDDSVELPPNSTDIAFLCNTYHHLEYPISTMRSIYRALKPGGLLINIDFKRIPGQSEQWIIGHVRAGQDIVAKEIQSVGFTLEANAPEITFLKETYFQRFRKPQ